MIPGESYIAHQDFLWGNDSFIQIFIFLARHSFAFHFAVPNSCMVVFKDIREFDPEMLQSIPLPDKLDRE